MSRSAGRVLIIPKGDYDPTYTYEMLDACEYNGSSYLCKQTSTGNLPTNKTYWQKLVEVGGDFMFQDGSNANALVVGPATKTSFMSATISKDAGADQDVSIAFTVTGSDPLLARNIKGILSAHIGDDVVYTNNGEEVKVTIASVTQAFDDSAVTAVGKLVDDITTAISASKTIYFYTYNNGTSGDVAAGSGAAINGHGAAFGPIASVYGSNGFAVGDSVASAGSGSVAFGRQTTAAASQSFSEGNQTLAFAANSHAEGNHTIASGASSHSSGDHTSASGDHSFAGGAYTASVYDDEFSIGRYNTNYGTTGKKSLFNVGNGDTTNGRSNAFTVYEDGMMANGSGDNRYKIGKESGAWGYRSDDDNKFHPFTGYKELIQSSVTLSTSQETTVTFTDAAITSSSTIEPFTTVYGINPTMVDSTTTPGECVVTLPKVTTAITIDVKIRVS